jgi:hypothetical protein
MNEKFQRAVELFDAENGRDPNPDDSSGPPRPRELLYAERLSAWVLKLAPGASEVLRLAARCQHICRWMIPRGSYPMTKPGYLRWRTDLKNFHAKKAGELLAQAGYRPDVIAQVQDLNLKKNFPRDPDSQVLEDALCLVFLEFQMAELAAKTSDDKMINALKKSWLKMSPPAREQALSLSFAEREKRLIGQALAP